MSKPHRATERTLVSLEEVCRRARVKRKDVIRAFEAIVDAALDGEEVRLTNIGFFRLVKRKGFTRRVPKIPITGPDFEYTDVTCPEYYLLHFRQSRSLGLEMRRRARGRSVGTWQQP